MAASSESQRLQSYSKFGLLSVGLALILTLSGSWFASSRPIAAIDQQKLENYHESLQSYAHEGLFIAQQYEHTRALANYTAVSSQKIYVAVSDLNTLLQTELPTDGLKNKVQQTSDQATELSDELSTLSKIAENGATSHSSQKLQSIVAELNKS
jgi:hypothetical protein